MQSINLGRIAFRLLGPYVAGTAYDFNSVVTKDSAAYVWTSDTSGVSNDFSGAGPWKLLVAGFNYCGAYSSTAVYRNGSIVLSAGSAWLYIGTTDISGSAPDVTDSQRWVQIAAGVQYVTFGLSQIRPGMIVTVGARSYLSVSLYTSGGDYAELSNTYLWVCIAGGLRNTGEWAPSRQYFVGDLFVSSGAIREVTTAFVSGVTFSGSNSREFLSGVPSASGVPDGKVLATADGGYAWTDASSANATRLTSAATLAAGRTYLLDSSTGSFSVSLPASPVLGSMIHLIGGSSLETAPVDVAFNGTPYGGVLEDLRLDLACRLTLIYINATIGWSDN